MILTRLQSLRSNLFGIPRPPEPASQNGALILSGVIATYLLFLLLIQPDLLLRGEMWAEMATNYFANAKSGNLWQQLFATDAGYIPLPQRFLALIANWLRLPAATVPYFYAWTAAVGTALMAGVFSLPVFRPLVRSDTLRVLTALLLLTVVDFETRTFINFTYFVPCFCAFLTALALTTPRHEVPRWAWLMVPLMLSKPAALVVLPAMLVTALVSAKRFRRIATACALVGVAQLARVVISQHEGAMPMQAANITLAAKLLATLKYFFGFLSGFSAGPTLYANHLVGKFNAWIYIGVALCLLLTIIVRKSRSPAGTLILVGSSLLFFTILLNCFALSSMWNRSMDRLIGIPVYRHIIVGYFGVVLVVVGFLETIGNSLHQRWKGKPRKVLSVTPVALFICWSLASGWWDYAFRLSSSPAFPAQGISQWQRFSPEIDRDGPICVPINPLGWVYTNQCAPIGPVMGWDQHYTFTSVTNGDDKRVLEISVPQIVSKARLMSLAVAVRPHAAQTALLAAQGYAQMQDGSRAPLSGSAIAPYSGALLPLSFAPDATVTHAVLIHLEFKDAVDIAFAEGNPMLPAVMWLGTPL